jgi:hypothetical protein
MRAVLERPKSIVGDHPRVDSLLVTANLTFAAVYPERLVRRIVGVRVPYVSRPD